MSELKPRSFRIDDETAEKLREITQSIGGNQQEALSKLIEAFEMQSGKAVLTEKKADIEQFERYISAITRMFMGSLEDNQNITATVRTEFEAQLISKDKTIIELQNKIELLQKERNEAVQVKDSLKESIELFNKRITEEYEPQIIDLSEELKNKEKQINILNDSYNELKQYKEELKQLQNRNKELQKENNQLNGQLLEQKQLLLESKENYLKQIEEYQKKYKELLDKPIEESKPKATSRKSSSTKSKAATTKKKETTDNGTIEN